MSRRTEDLEREFEGYEVLNKLLAESGAIADAQDVADAFAQAAKDGVPAPDVIHDLWVEEPRFERPAHAARLFGNLLALFDLVAAGEAPAPAAAKAPKVKRVKASKPAPFDDAGPTAEFLTAAGRYFDDSPKERERQHHAFDNRQDALVSWLDDSGLSDAGFALARYLLGEWFAALELGGRKVPSLDETLVPKQATFAELPPDAAAWLTETLSDESSGDENPLPEDEIARVRDVVARAAVAMWKT